jgi:Uma2 family endonuclease
MTTVLSPISSPTFDPTILKRYKFTCEQYNLMMEARIFAGVFKEGTHTKTNRLELIRGEIIDMSPISAKHNACIARLTEFFVTELHGQAIIYVQSSLRLDSHSEPQPDLVLLKPRSDFYEAELPKPSDVLLIIEVADSSISYDRDVKVPLYAEAGIEEFWLVDINNRILTSYTSPAPDGYAKSHRFRSGDSIPILAFPDVAIPWANVFGQN